MGKNINERTRFALPFCVNRRPQAERLLSERRLTADGEKSELLIVGGQPVVPEFRIREKVSGKNVFTIE